MSNQKSLSHLSFAAAALLAAALPCFAQTESNQARNNQAGNLNATEVTQIAALGTERVIVNKAETKKTAEAKMSEKRATLSADQFVQAAKVSSSADAFLATQIFAAPKVKPNDNDETVSRKITFVPSKGQKLPGSVNSQ
jgi:hypothetical protein